MDIKKRKDPSSAHFASAIDDSYEIDIPQAKRQRKNSDVVEIRAQSGQPLSRKELRNLERNEQRRKQRKRSRKKIPIQRKPVSPQLELVQEQNHDDEDLTAMLSVLDFSKEAEPRHLGQDTKILYMKNALTEDNHFKILADNLRSLEDNRINPNVPDHPSHYKKKWSGWQADELRRSNILDMVGCGPSDLNNPIHPVFRFENFDRCPRAVYDQFLPALRLASQFLTHPACSRYWITLFTGTHFHDANLSHELGQKVYRLPKLEEFSPEAASRALQLFEQISHHVTFDFKPRLSIKEVECYGIARCESKMLKSTHQYLSTDETDPRWEWEYLLGNCASDDNFDPMKIHTRVHLSLDFYAYAKYTRKLTYADEAVRLRFNLFFANILCHELAHGVEMRRMLLEYGRAFREAGRPSNRTPILRNTETFLYDWNVAEAGRGFEVTTFGTSVQPINNRCDGAAGLHTLNFPQTSAYQVLHAVPMSYINAIQKQTFWDGQSIPDIIKHLRVPKVGVPSVNSGTMTTLSWKEYLQIQEEEGNGHYHVEDLSEPPPSKSVQSTERQPSNASSGNDDRLGSASKASSGSNDSLPASPTDPALKKPEELTLADKWKLAAEYFVLEGGLSIGFHMQRTMGTLLLPESLQPWNRKSWQQAQLNDLLSMRATKKAQTTANVNQQQGQSAQDGELEDIDASVEFKNFVKAAAIADNPVKAEKWKCLEEMVWLQHGSNRALQFLHTREAGTLDFTDIEYLDPDRPDSFGADVMAQLHELRIAFIRKRIDEEKKATFSFPAVARTTSEDERQEVLNFFRPITERVKVGGLPTPARSIKETEPAPKSTENDVEKGDDASDLQSKERNDQHRDAEATKTEGSGPEKTEDGGILEKDQQHGAEAVKTKGNGLEKTDDGGILEKDHQHDAEAAEIDNKATEDADGNKELEADRNHDAEAVEPRGNREEDGCAGETLRTDPTPETKPQLLQDDDDLVDDSDEDQLLDSHDSGVVVQETGEASMLATPPASEMDNQPAQMETKDLQHILVASQLPSPSTSPDSSPPLAPIAAGSVPDNEQSDDSSWPPDIEGELDELDEPHEPVTPEEWPTRRDQDWETSNLDRKPQRPDKNRARSRSRSPRRDSTEDELGFGTFTPSPRRFSEELPFVMMPEAVKENVPSRSSR